MSYTISDIRKIVEVQRAFFRSGTTLDVSWRLKQLRKLRDAVIAHEAEFEEALAGEYRSRIVFGGKGNPAGRRYAPTVIYPVGIDGDIVRKELFCPLLPVVPFKDAEVDKVLAHFTTRVVKCANNCLFLHR